MAEQSLRERMHPTATQLENRAGRMKLLVGAIIGLAAAAALGRFNGALWAIPGLMVAAACCWGFFAIRPRRA